MQDFIFCRNSEPLNDELDDFLYSENVYSDKDLSSALRNFDAAEIDFSSFCLKRLTPKCYIKLGHLSLSGKAIKKTPRKDVLKFLKIAQDEPSPPALVHNTENKLMSTLIRAFDQKPILPLRRLTQILKETGVNFQSLYALKKELCNLCYMFSHGPFKNSLIVKGYDPRTDPRSLQLQVFSVEVSGQEINNFASKSFKNVQIEELIKGELQEMFQIIPEDKFSVALIEEIRLAV